MMSSPVSGYNAVFFMRADYADIAARNAARTTEMVWAPSPSLGMAGATYAGILYGGYCSLPEIAMDIGSNSPPIMDDPALEDYNLVVGGPVLSTINAVFDALTKVPQGGPGGDGTVDIMLPLGCDFAYENAATVRARARAWRSRVDALGLGRRARRRHAHCPCRTPRRPPCLSPRLPPLPRSGSPTRTSSSATSTRTAASTRSTPRRPCTPPRSWKRAGATR